MFSPGSFREPPTHVGEKLGKRKQNAFIFSGAFDEFVALTTPPKRRKNRRFKLGVFFFPLLPSSFFFPSCPFELIAGDGEVAVGVF